MINILIILFLLFGETKGQIINQYSMWRTTLQGPCHDECPISEAHNVASFNVTDLTPGIGYVLFEAFPFMDCGDNILGGQYFGYGYYEIYIDGQRIDSNVDGVVLGAPPSGMFRKFDGNTPFICCYDESNYAQFITTAKFYNDHLVNNTIDIEIVIPFDSNIPCLADNNECRNIDAGQQVVAVTWEPIGWNTFHLCLTGPDIFIENEDCIVYDYDEDGDVDMVDVSIFILNGEL